MEYCEQRSILPGFSKLTINAQVKLSTHYNLEWLRLKNRKRMQKRLAENVGVEIKVIGNLSSTNVMYYICQQTS